MPTLAILVCLTFTADPLPSAQGIRLGDRPSPDYIKKNNVTAYDLQKPEFYRRHEVELKSGKLVQYLGFIDGKLEVVTLEYDPNVFEEVAALYEKQLGPPAQISIIKIRRMWRTDEYLVLITRSGPGSIASAVWQAHMRRKAGIEP